MRAQHGGCQQPSDSASESRPRIRVVQALKPPDGTTRYVDQMVDGAPPEVEVAFFSWRLAMLSSYDVLHLHWPERLIRGGGRPNRAAKQVMLVLLLLRCKLTHTKIVRTVHNLQPHEPGAPVETALLRLVDRLTDASIRLNPATPDTIGKRSELILHGHYRERFARYRTDGATAARPPDHQAHRNTNVLYFGLIRPYKGVPALIAAFEDWQQPEAHLRIVGHPTPDLRAAVEHAVDAGNGGVSCRLEFVADDVLTREIGAARLVVLPYEQIHNSGVVLVALSLDRHVVVTRSASTEALQAEVGDDWVTLFDPPFTREDLERGWTRASSDRGEARPSLGQRDWDVIGERHYSLYLELLRR